MSYSASASKKSVILKGVELRQLFAVSLQLTDTLEDILEAHGEYSEEFLRGLKKSIKEMKESKTVSIQSLSELR